MTLDGGQGGLDNERIGGAGLLRLGDVGASVLAITDTLPCPGGFCRERVDELHPRRMSTVRTTSNERDKTNLRGNGDTEEVDETMFLS